VEYQLNARTPVAGTGDVHLQLAVRSGQIFVYLMKILKKQAEKEKGKVST
jgi:hypothetical protein